MKLFLYCFREFDEKIYYDELKKERGFTYDSVPDYPNMENAELARGYDCISVTVVNMDAPLLERFASLGVKYISTRSIGFEHIDLDAAKRLGLKVCHVVYPPESVANYAIMLMMMGLRKVRPILDRAAVQDFSLKGKLGSDISSCTVGVIGTGKIGATVIKHLSSFGSKIIAYDVYKNPELEDVCEYVSLDTLYEQSDVITIHIPASAENHHLLSTSAFSKMKSNCIIVNTARGSIIDTEAMIDALKNNRIGGAALDVVEDEIGMYYLNRIGDNLSNTQLAALKSFPNVVVTPHTAFYTDIVVRGMAEHTVQCIYDMEAGKENPLVIV